MTGNDYHNNSGKEGGFKELNSRNAWVEKTPKFCVGKGGVFDRRPRVDVQVQLGGDSSVGENSRRASGGGVGKGWGGLCFMPTECGGGWGELEGLTNRCGNVNKG